MSTTASWRRMLQRSPCFQSCAPAPPWRVTCARRTCSTPSPPPAPPVRRRARAGLNGCRSSVCSKSLSPPLAASPAALSCWSTCTKSRRLGASSACASISSPMPATSCARPCRRCSASSRPCRVLPATTRPRAQNSSRSCASRRSAWRASSMICSRCRASSSTCTCGRRRRSTWPSSPDTSSTR